MYIYTIMYPKYNFNIAYQRIKAPVSEPPRRARLV